ncbi:alanine/glycine:cation symporter family protein [Cellulomonas marina]|uniref:Alanine or glycine:cation symporter, AGCS family n=1 Tax=Cellulomonas marina TaxID=988821 RepID=A0A1I0V3F7_9CELL|nr:alanine/glycine:cation symporter family protein [Cellulomonas marina]GIG28306.1 sodium:alanine symporter [Cellulomonas marina]SFA70858.1 alanine or glycine:cation symporter, AGCS family [Cellulomonas marina]
MDWIQQTLIDPVSTVLWTYVLVYVLLGVGLYLGVRTRFVQVRMFGTMMREVASSRSGSADGISSFQAFCVGLASRVGTGNIAGVAIALTLGGPGAIFWMWVVALVGMATALVEATLAQIFKVPAGDGSFRGGPAFYIERGLRSRRGGILFAVLLIFTFGIAFNMVQANTIADVLDGGHGVAPALSALGLMVLTAPVVFGGVRRIARVAEVLLPAMALAYVLLALVIIAMNVTAVGSVLGTIVQSAFGVGEAAAGITGGVAAALLNGARRGLFSNEAGMGSAPNAAATATTTHPVKQGLIQSLGVFVDTIVVCSATAFIILFAGSGVYVPGETTEGASLTQAAVVDQLGSVFTPVMTVLVFVFAFSSVLGNYSYAEVNMGFLRARPAVLTVFRVVVVACVGFGAVADLVAVWALADVAMGLMALVNLVALVLLAPWALGALRDFERQRRAGLDPVFRTDANLDLPRELPDGVWAAPAGAGSPERQHLPTS